MNASFCFAICSFFYIILIIVMYFSKERLKNIENKIYSILLITTLVGVSLEISSTILELTNNAQNIIHDLILKFIMIYYLSWIFIFFIYTYYISKKEKNINFKPFIIIYTLLALITFSLPLYPKIEGTLVVYTYGPSVDFMYALSGVLILGCIILLFKNFSQIKKQKYVPLLAFIGVGVIVVIFQILIPSLLLISTLETFIAIMMYFTIENPDVKMLEEMYKNKKMLEKNNESTSNFLFKISQDIKYPVNQIVDKSSEYDNYEERLKNINNIGRNLKYSINNVLDISNIDIKNLKIYNTKYSPDILFEELKCKTENQLSNKVKFEYKISPNIPKSVYGDSIKIKQILQSTLENSLKHTKEGFIELDVNAIIKYDVCRLIIDVTDSGEGISIEKVNEILTITKSENKTTLDGKTLTLKEIKSLVTQMGGSFMIKSEKKKGTTVSIILDQKIAELEEKVTQNLEQYETSVIKNKRVIVVDDDAKELTNITNYLEKNNIMVYSSLFGQDVIDKVANNYKFDLIILDDETTTDSAFTTLKELKKTEKFKTPVIVMINDNKKTIKDYYLQDGFSDIILKSNLNEELDRILKKL